MPDEGVEVKPPPGVETKSPEKPAEKGQEPSREKSPWRKWIAGKLHFLGILLGALTSLSFLGFVGK